MTTKAKINYRRQGSKIVKGREYPVYQCNHCSHLVPLEEEVLCWQCGKGEMTFLGGIIMKEDSLPEYEENEKSKKALVETMEGEGVSAL